MMMPRYIELLLFFCLNSKLTCSIKPMMFRRKSPPKSVGVKMRGGASKTAISDNRMPSLFGPEDAQYDRYAACLAATEGLRRLRDKELEEGSSSESLFDDSLQVTKQVNARYVQNAGKVLKALGMSVSQFNTLGRQISQDSRLKEKVMEQAYLYRMAATLNMDRMPLIDDTTIDPNLRKEKVQMFCDSMTEIEHLRENQLERLKTSLRVDKFPPNVSISDPNLLPFLNARVRAVVEAFPLQAEEIVKKHGLQSDEFNMLLREARSNPIFRWKIQKYIKETGDGGKTMDDHQL